MAALKIELRSKQQADQFVSLLTSTIRRFDISVKLDWQATTTDLKHIFCRITRIEQVTLEIDGVTSLIHSQDRVEHGTDFFGNFIPSNDQRIHKLHTVVLLNYPRPQERYIYTKSLKNTKLTYGLRCGLNSFLIGYRWQQLRQVFDEIVVSDNIEWVEVSDLSRKLETALLRNGISDVTSLSLYDSSWQGLLDLRLKAFT